MKLGMRSRNLQNVNLEREDNSDDFVSCGCILKYVPSMERLDGYLMCGTGGFYIVTCVIFLFSYGQCFSFFLFNQAVGGLYLSNYLMPVFLYVGSLTWVSMLLFNANYAIIGVFYKNINY